eukprot:SAG31_NODE_13997_length_833_cov_0.618529_2_plen_119_part_00
MVATMVASFLQDGFVMLPALERESLEQLTSAFRRAQKLRQAVWEESVAQDGTGPLSRSFDMNDFEMPSSFLRNEAWIRSDVLAVNTNNQSVCSFRANIDREVKLFVRCVSAQMPSREL